MSLVTYNGITLPYSNTTSFSQDVVYDDQGNTDWICTRFDIQVQCIINEAYLSTISSEFTGMTGNAADIMKAIRVLLLQPRCTLSFKCNGTELIPDATAGPGTVDVWNGPKPQRCSITQVTTNTFVLIYHIIAHYWENYTESVGDTLERTNAPGAICLYNRWSETVDIDNCMMTRKTREGKFMIRSDNDKGRIADEMRTQMAVVGVPTGFLRESSSYTVSPDGLSVRYRIVDKEYFKIPPSPAFQASGSYSVTTVGLGTCITYGEANVKLRGSKYMDQGRLADVAVSICSTKLYINGAPVTTPPGNPDGPRRFALLISAALTINMYENEVTCSMKSMLQAKPVRKYGMAAITNETTFTPHSDEANSVGAFSRIDAPVYADRGSAGLLLHAAAYYDPSIPDSKLAPGTVRSQFNQAVTGSGRGAPNLQMDTGLEPGKAGVTDENNQ